MRMTVHGAVKMTMMTETMMTTVQLEMSMLAASGAEMHLSVRPLTVMTMMTTERQLIVARMQIMMVLLTSSEI